MPSGSAYDSIARVSHRLLPFTLNGAEYSRAFAALPLVVDGTARLEYFHPGSVDETAGIISYPFAVIEVPESRVTDLESALRLLPFHNSDSQRPTIITIQPNQALEASASSPSPHGASPLYQEFLASGRVQALEAALPVEEEEEALPEEEGTSNILRALLAPPEAGVTPSPRQQKKPAPKPAPKPRASPRSAPKPKSRAPTADSDVRAAARHLVQQMTRAAEGASRRHHRAPRPRSSPSALAAASQGAQAAASPTLPAPSASSGAPGPMRVMLRRREEPPPS